MKTRPYYLVGICVVVIIVLLVLLAWPKSSTETSAIEACIQGGGSFDVTAQTCSPNASSSSSTSTTGSTKTIPSAGSKTTPTTTTVSAIVYTPASAANQIQVTSLIANASLYPSSPVQITGKALGPWYFEATFPIELTKADGTVISSGVATAQSTWTVQTFVEFKGNLSYPQQPHGTKGYVILKRDNPSGLSQNDASVKILVTFQ